MGKKADRGRAAASEETPPPSAQRILKKRGKNSGWPWWLWGVSAVAILAIVGQIFGGDAPRNGKGKGKAAAGKSTGVGSTQGYLAIALRISEMTQIATALKATDQLDGEAAKTLDAELTDIEKEIEPMEDKMARDLRSMVTVIRGTLYQQSANLTDEQVEKMNNSYTYANPRYWDDYYKKLDEAERFDWYVSWDTATKPANKDEAATWGDKKLSAIVGPLLKKESKVLMLGCGNSDMSEKMYRDGFEEITNIDISEQLIQNFKQKQQTAMPKMQWLFMDATAMSFDTGSFDAVIDKGTLDAVEQNKELVLGSIREAHRVLKSGGLFISVTFNSAAIRVEQQLQKEMSWSSCVTHPFLKELLSAQNQDKQNSFYVHACTKP